MRLNPNYYTTSEKRTYLLVAIILICVSSIRLYIFSVPLHKQSNFDRIIPEVSAEAHSYKSHQSSPVKSKAEKKSRLKTNPTAYLQHAYPFDPNKIEEHELQKMKFPENGIQNLLKYRTKGGSIKSSSHFKRIWGFEEIDASFLDSILILPIKSTEPQFSPKLNEYAHFEQKEKPKEVIPKKLFTQSFVDINNCDTTELKSLKGIGTWRASKIIEFREQLGGFHSIEQLSGLSFLPDSIYQPIKPQLMVDSSSIRQLLINQLTLKELAQHPYISYAKARMMTNYIVEHGPFEEEEQLFRLRGLDSTFIRQILPYLDLSLDIPKNTF